MKWNDSDLISTFPVDKTARWWKFHQLISFVLDELKQFVHMSTQDIFTDMFGNLDLMGMYIRMCIES